jgi:hypothetical protein
MTLILTLWSPERIIQVSDRRLTGPNGKLVTDEANKAVGVWCDDAHFSVAYTGLARVRHAKTRRWIGTDKWIADTIGSIMQSGINEVREIYRAFAVEAAETVASTPVPRTKTGTTFVFAGFFYRSRVNTFLGSLSNMSLGTDGKVIKVSKHFDVTHVYSLRPTMPLNEKEINVDGMVPALISKDAIAKAINRRTRVIHRRLERVRRSENPLDELAEAKELISIVRMASRHPEYGRYIGRDCMAVVLNYSSWAITADTYKEDSSVMHDWPIMVFPEGAATVSGKWYFKQVSPEEAEELKEDDDAP